MYYLSLRICEIFILHIYYIDVGPFQNHLLHVNYELSIIVRKNKKREIIHIKLILDILGKNKNLIKRSNKIIYKKKIFIKYPFENELNKLPNKEKNFAVKKFMNNKYKNIKPQNMKEFFLKVFGLGITKLYLEPYNKKIWKYPITKLDMQMVERIPRPPKKDIINSAKGISSEGYKHQLYFHYPKKGGVETLFNSFKSKLSKKVKIYVNQKILKIKKKNLDFCTKTNLNEIRSQILVSTIPLKNFNKIYKTDSKITKYSNRLKYNSIIISIFKIKGDVAGNNFALMIPDKDIIFHRISKLNFLGKNYFKKNYTYFEVEITYRRGTRIDKLSNKSILNSIFYGLKKLKFVERKTDIKSYVIKRFKYAYVIYDLLHRQNTDKVLQFLRSIGMQSNGRFAEFEYMNSDQVAENSMILAKELN